MKPKKAAAGISPGISKSATGIKGLDEITGGGVPTGRPTLLCGGPGCGKTLFAMTFLVRGAIDLDEPGVFLSFEEKSEELVQNVASLGYDLPALMARKKLAMDFVRIERGEIEETGEYDLEGLFVRLGYAIDSVGAKRVVLDTIEALFAGLSDTGILRAELRRLFAWLKERGLTAIITAERGEGMLTRQGLEEYVSDCVILLDNRVTNQLSTRRLRIVKYRGSSHGSNEYPFLIEEHGISVLPITSAGLEHEASSERVATGIASLDAMLGGKGLYKGSTLLVSGTAGTGKTTFSAAFLDAACRRGENVIYFALEESPSQIIRNMRSAGIDLERWVKKGLLRFVAARPSLYGLETHLLVMARQIEQQNPAAVVIDPASSLVAEGSGNETHEMMLRIIDILKTRGITALLTSLDPSEEPGARESLISSLIDTWIVLRSIESTGERNRTLFIRKSRGMAHSNQIREFLLSDGGVQLLDADLGSNGGLTGSARLAREAADRATTLQRHQTAEHRRRSLQRKREALESQIAAMRAALAFEEHEMIDMIGEEDSGEGPRIGDRGHRAIGREASSGAPATRRKR